MVKPGIEKRGTSFLFAWKQSLRKHLPSYKLLSPIPQVTKFLPNYWQHKKNLERGIEKGMIFRFVNLTPRNKAYATARAMVATAQVSRVGF